MDLTALLANLTALMSAGSVLAFVAGGILLIVQVKRLAGMALMVGAGLAVGAGLLPALTADLSSMPPLSLLAILSAIAGVIALALRRAKLGMGLLWPAFSRWILWPMVGPFLPQESMWLVVLVVAPFAAFILIWILQRVLRPIYGDGVADHVAGTYLVRAIDATGRALGWLIAAPFQALMRLFSRS